MVKANHVMSSNRLRRTIVAVAVVPALLLAAEGSAFAINTLGYWNSQGTPLSVSGYGSTAWAYGSAKIADSSNGLKLYSYAKNKFIDGDNHLVYVEGESQFNAGSCRAVTATVTVNGVEVSSTQECRAVFYDKESYRTDGLNYTTSTWTSLPTKSFGVQTGADRGRVTARVCIDVPLRWDPVSGTAISSPADTW